MNNTFGWRSLYDKNWLKIYSSFFTEEETEKEIDLFLKTTSVKKSHKILDLCCGYGRHSIALAKRGYKVVGFDYSLPFLKKAKADALKNGVKIDFVQGDIRQLPYQDEFDLVLMSYPAAFYFDDFQNKEIFFKLVKALKPGGKIFLITADTEGCFREYFRFGKKLGNQKYLLENEFKADKTTVYRGRTLDFKKQIEKTKIQFRKGKKIITRNLNFHYYTQDQIEGVLIAAGFEVKEFIKNFYESLPPRVIIVAQKRKEMRNNKKLRPEIIIEIEKIRKNRWRIPPWDKLGLVVAGAKSYNKRVREETLETLDSFYAADPDKSIKKAETVDLMEEFEQFSSRERRLILKELYAVELTKGCTGNCYFCCTGIKKRIEKKYSFESIKKFYQKYKNFIPKRDESLEEIRKKLLKKFPKYYKYFPLDLPKERDVFLYWETDPFVYKDGQYTIYDVYKLMVDHGRGKFSRQLSSSLTPGSLRNFVIFFEKIAEEYCQKKMRTPILRLSLAKHTAQRIEAALKFLYYDLLSLGYPQKEIIQLFNDSMSFHIRDESTLWKVGRLIKKADRFHDIISPSCKEGVALAPNNSRVQMMVAASRFFPTGSLYISLEKNKNNLEKSLVVTKSLFNYAYYIMYKDIPRLYYDPVYHLIRLLSLIRQDEIFLRLPKKLNGEDFRYGEKGNSLERLSFSLFRYSFSLRHFIAFCSQMGLSDFPVGLKNEFLFVSYQDYNKFRKKIIRDIKTAKNQSFKLKKRRRANYKLEFSISLTEFYLNQVDLLMEFVNKGKDPDLVVSLAKLLLKLGENESKNLKQILKNLEEITFLEGNEEEALKAIGLILPHMKKSNLKHLKDIIKATQKIFSYRYIKKFLGKKIVREDLNEKVTEIILKEIGVYWGFKKEDELPKWGKELKNVLLTRVLTLGDI